MEADYAADPSDLETDSTLSRCLMNEATFASSSLEQSCQSVIDNPSEAVIPNLTQESVDPMVVQSTPSLADDSQTVLVSPGCDHRRESTDSIYSNRKPRMSLNPMHSISLSKDIRPEHIFSVQRAQSSRRLSYSTPNTNEITQLRDEVTRQANLIDEQNAEAANKAKLIDEQTDLIDSLRGQLKQEQEENSLNRIQTRTLTQRILQLEQDLQSQSIAFDGKFQSHAANHEIGEDGPNLTYIHQQLTLTILFCSYEDLRTEISQ